MLAFGKLIPTSIVLLVALVVIQVHIQKNKLVELKTNEELNLFLEEFEGLYMKSFEQHNETVVHNSVYHAHYLKNIKVSDSDPRLPADINREYSYDDFVSVFEVEPLHNLIFEDDVADILKGHDLTNDEYYQNSQDCIKQSLEKFGPLLAQGSLEERDREYIAIKFISPRVGFGAFAKKLIKKGELIGEYTGVITKDGQDSDYMWDYPSKIVNGKEFNLGNDARQKGNYLRFINHERTDFNTEPEVVPYENTWRVLYVAVRDIQPGEEMTTNYGDNFESSLA